MVDRQESLRTRFVSDSLHALVSRLKPSRFRNFLHRAVCFFTGHPVDVASGKVMTEFVDVQLPGPLPLKVERIYSSAFASREGPLGHGWSLSLDQAVWRERGKVVFRAEDGRELEFDTFDFPRHRLEPGQQVYDPKERLTLRCEKNDAWRVVDHEGVVREFAPVPGRDDGRAMIQKIRSRCGYHEITYHYGTEGAARGRLEWVRDSGGRFVHLRWDAQGRVTELHLPKPQGEGFYLHRRFAHDAAGDLVAVIDPLDKPYTFEYTAHRMVRHTDRNGLSFYYRYEAHGDGWRVDHAWGDGGLYDYRFAYLDVIHERRITDSLGHVSVVKLDENGLPINETDPLGGITIFEYDDCGRSSAVVDPAGRRTEYLYDARGNLLKLTRQDGSAVETEFDAANKAIRITDPSGAVWQQAWDGRGQLVAQPTPLGHSNRYEYDSFGQLVAHTNSRGARSGLAYDGDGNLTQIDNALGQRTRLAYDGLGNLIARKDPAGRLTRYQYDAKGRLGAVVLPSVFEEQIWHEQRILDQLVEHGTESYGEALSYFPTQAAFAFESSNTLGLVEKASKTLPIPVIASINGTTDSGWTDTAHDMEEAGAAAIELNVYFLPTDPTVSGSDVERRTLDVVRAVCETVSIPVAVKIGPYFSSPAHMAKRIKIGRAHV